MTVEVPLVLEIQKHQCLYNFNIPEYNRKDILDAAWSEVANNVRLTVNECKDKWKNIRSSFVRSLKYSGGKLKKPYYLSHYLQFIVPFLKPTSNIEVNAEDLQPPDGSAEDTSDEVPTVKIEPVDSDNEHITFDDINTVAAEIEKPSSSAGYRFDVSVRKRRRQNIPVKNYAVYQRNKNKKHIPITSTRMENNALRYFLLSLLPEFDTMDEEQIRLFKIKVMMLIDDIKADRSSSKKELQTRTECERLQKRLINLLLKNLENNK